MTAAETKLTHVYEPCLAEDENEYGGRTIAAAPPASGLPHAILLKNVLWFCRLRWVVVAILVLYGCTYFAGQTLEKFSLRPPGLWPLILALVLALANVGFLAHAAGLENKPEFTKAGTTSLWIQILFDLLVLTVVVYFLGGAETFFPFAYLFHIGIACIFFPRSWSFLVTIVACVFFSCSVVLAEAGVLPDSSIYLNSQVDTEHSGVMAVVNLISAQLIWIVVWYLMSHLSALVRARDAELARANQRLIAAQEERTRHMLQTTHELKAPFAAIHANTQLLLKGHCGVLTDQTLDVVVRIAARARRLAREIQDMLQLANLNASSQRPFQAVELNLTDLLGRCVDQVRALAEEKNVALSFDARIQDGLILGVEDHLKMMFDNLLANAVMYSQESGTVQIECSAFDNDAILVVIEDNGIGIPPEKLPKIFDEYYRTNEAVRHWKESTGLGLAIVKRVAASHQIRLKVSSEVGKGTRFELIVPVKMRLHPS